MKRTGKYALITVLVLGLAVFMTACGSKSSDGGGVVSNTTITTTTQGAQSAAASVSAAQGVASTAGNFSSMGASLSSLSGAPALKALAANAPATPVSRFAARFKPAALKARALAAAAQSGTQTIDCATGQAGVAGANNTETLTYSVNPPTMVLTMTAKNCTQGTSTINGTETITFTLNMTTGEVTSLTAVIGTEGAPFTETDTAGFRSETAATLGITTSPDRITANGRFEDWDTARNTHEKQVMSNLSISLSSTTALISAATYSVDTLAINGGMAFTEYTAATGVTVKKGESGSFTNLTLVAKTPVNGSVSGTFDYMSINGGMTLTTLPAATCTDGTFDVVTNTDLKIDNTTGNTVAGKITINTNTVVTFKADGSVDVSLNNGTPVNYTEAQLLALCPL